jgi:hypothetical protein
MHDPPEEGTMRRTHRALVTLALGSLALVAAITTAVAEPVAPTENSEETKARKALYQSELEHNLQRRGPATAPVTDPTATALWEAEQRRVARVPDPFVPPPATATAANPSLEAPGANLDALAALLLGLVGGLVGGAAALIGWTISTRRRLPRTVAGT